MKTTLNKIRKKSPCEDGWEKLLKGLGKTKADDEPLDYLTIFEINGLDDTLWCLDKVEHKQKELRLFSVWCAKRVRRLVPIDEQEKFDDVLAVVERYANGLATEDELVRARTSAWDSALASAWDSAWASAWASASAWDSASASAWDSAKKEIEDYFIKEVLKNE